MKVILKASIKTARCSTLVLSIVLRPTSQSQGCGFSLFLLLSISMMVNASAGTHSTKMTIYFPIFNRLIILYIKVDKMYK